MDIPSSTCMYSRLLQDIATPAGNVSSATLSFDFRPGNTDGSGDFVNSYLAVLFAGRCKWMLFETEGLLIMPSSSGATTNHNVVVMES